MDVTKTSRFIVRMTDKKIIIDGDKQTINPIE